MAAARGQSGVSDSSAPAALGRLDRIESVEQRPFAGRELLFRNLPGLEHLVRFAQLVLQPVGLTGDLLLGRLQNMPAR